MRPLGWLVLLTIAGGGTLAAADGQWAERLRTHLEAPRVEERMVALRICLSLHDPALSRLALQSLKARTELGDPEAALLGQLCVAVPDDERMRALVEGDDSVARAVATSFAAVTPERLLQLVAPLCPGADVALGRRLGLIITPAIARAGDETKSKLLALQGESADPYERAARIQRLPHSALTQQDTLAALADQSAIVRHAMLYRLGERQGERPSWLTSVLRVALADVDAGVRADAIQFLGAWAAKPADDAEDLRKLEAALGDPSSAVRAAACAWAARLGDRVGEAFLLHALDDPDPRVRTGAVRWAVAARTPSALLRLEKEALDPAAPACVAALAALVQLEPRQAADIAATLGSDADPGHAPLRIRALETLDQLKDPRAAELAARLLVEPNASSRKAAATSLAAKAPLEGQLTQVIAGADAGIGDRRQLLERLVALEPRERQDELERVYQGLDGDARVSFVRTLMGSGASSFVPDFLVRRILDQDARVAQLALAMMPVPSSPPRGNGHEYIGYCQALARLDDPDPMVASAARAVVARADFPSLLAQAVPPRPPASDPDPLSASFTQDGGALLLAFVKSWVGGPVPQAMPSDPAVVEALLQLLESGPEASRPAAAMVLGRCDDERALAALHRSARARSLGLRLAARMALLEQGDESPETTDFGLAWISGLYEYMRTQAIGPPADPATYARLEGASWLAASARTAVRAWLDAHRPRTVDLNGAAAAPASPMALAEKALPPIGMRMALHIFAWKEASAPPQWNPVRCEHADDHGVPLLRLSCVAGSLERSAVRLDLPQAMPVGTVDLIARAAGASAIRVGVVLIDDQQLQAASEPTLCSADGTDHLLRFDLRASIFKNPAGGAATPVGMSDTSAIMIVVWNGNSDAVIELRNVALPAKDLP